MAENDKGVSRVLTQTLSSTDVARPAWLSWQIQNQTQIQCWEHQNAVLSECMRRRSWPAVTAIELRSGESAEKCSRKKSEKNYQEIPNKNHYEIQQRIRGEIQKITEKSKNDRKRLF